MHARLEHFLTFFLAWSLYSEVSLNLQIIEKLELIQHDSVKSKITIKFYHGFIIFRITRCYLFLNSAIWTVDSTQYIINMAEKTSSLGNTYLRWIMYHSTWKVITLEWQNEICNAPAINIGQFYSTIHCVSWILLWSRSDKREQLEQWKQCKKDSMGSISRMEHHIMVKWLF